MESSGEILVRKQFAQIPPYLRHLFREISLHYTTEAVNYSLLLTRILQSDFHRIALVTTNYDTFLEKALRRVIDTHFPDLDAYVADPRWILVKLHGSVDWVHPMRWHSRPNDLNGYLTILDDIATGASLSDCLTSGISFWNNPNLWDERRAYYPAMTVPVAGKYEYVCPQRHIDVLREHLRECVNFLVIGSSGLDADVTDLLRNEVPSALTFGFVAHRDVIEVQRRFMENVSAFAAAKTTLANGGFSKFIASGGLAAFLGYLYDDSDRDPWLKSKGELIL